MCKVGAMRVGYSAGGWVGGGKRMIMMIMMEACGVTPTHKPARW